MSTDSGEDRRAPTVRHFLEMKERGERIVALTVYDAAFARLLEEAGVDLLLVGDSLGQVVLGLETTLPVTVDQMIHHAAAVRRGAPRSFVVVDMPFLSTQVSVTEAVRNAGRVLKETGAQAVKVEGGDPSTVAVVDRLVTAGIPVMGHLGLTPQSIHALGGYRVQGRGEDAARRLEARARALEEAGAFALVLELVPRELATRVSGSLRIPTVGIGAGPGCDGQVLVLYDALGLNPGFSPRFLRRFAELGTEVVAGVRDYARAVREGSYPGPEHSYADDPA